MTLYKLKTRLGRGKKGKRFLVAAAILVLAVFAFVSLNQLIVQSRHSADQGLPDVLTPVSWMSKGTYATYVGTVNGTNSPVNITGKLQVADLNQTHVYVCTDMSISTSFTPTVADRTYVWVDRKNIDFGPRGETFVGKRRVQTSILGLGVRDCVAYDYTNEAINATYYLDKTLQWPLRITYTTFFENQTYVFEMNLIDTNIRQLN